MDKPQKKQHGGPREGGGRPKVLGAAYRIADKYIAADGSKPSGKELPTEIPEAAEFDRKGKRVRELEDLLARFIGETMSPVGTASELRELALGTLKNVMERSPSDQARVGAAREVLSRADLETVPKGKKAASKAMAEEKAKEGGKFAPPSQPKAAEKTVQ